MEGEVLIDPMFKKINALQKILQKANNKTYSYKESFESNYEVAIKIEICKVFQYLLDVRQEFFVQNSMGFFKSIFVPTIVNTPEYEWGTMLSGLLPEDPLKVGEDFIEIAQTKTYID